MSMTKKETAAMSPDPKIVETINSMSHYEMAKLWRFATSVHPYFDSSQPYSKIFDARFKELGGMTPEISKSLGW